jgi:uncharacterized protein (TIGR02996 family)
MSDRDALLAAIIADPDEDTPRLVFADWLQENGDADRGEFIRVEIELARTPPTEEADERRRKVLFGRRAALLKRHKAAWLAPFAPFAKESSFERGFVQSLEVSAHVFLSHAAGWAAVTPLTRLKIAAGFDWDHGPRERSWWAPDLFASPHLGRLTALDLEGLRITAADLGPLAAQPDLSRLRELVLTWNVIGNGGARLLADMPQLGGLEELDIRGNGITDAGARAVALSRHLTRLKRLYVSRNPVNAGTWALLRDQFGDALVG